VDFVTGSTRFGSTGSNTHQFTGSVGVEGTGIFYQPLTNSTSYLTVQNNRARNAAVYTATTNGGFYAGTSIGTDTFNYQIYDGVAGAARLTISSTGVASFTNSIKYTGTGNILDASSGNTNYLYQYLVNTGGGLYFGIERNTGGGLFTNSSAYATVLGSTTATSLQFGTTGIIRMTITSGGIAVVGHTAGVGTNFSPPVQVKGGAGAGNGFGIISANNEIAGGIQLASSGTNSINITCDPDNLRASSEIGFLIDNSVKMTITSGGAVTINTPSSAVEALTTNGAAGAWGAAINGSTTTGSSYGLVVQGGTNSSDVGFLVRSQNGGVNYLRVRGDGYLFSTPTYNNTWPGTSANMYVASDGSFGRITASSRRFKENIIDWSGNGLDTILALKPKTFKYKKDYCNSPDSIDFLGLIAEEVAEVLPYLAQYENPDRTGLVENVRYDTIVVPLIKAIQELKTQNDDLQSQINELKAQ
jgi:hypothetical protein